MKCSIIVLSIVLSVVAANKDFDWSNVIPIEDFIIFQQKYQITNIPKPASFGTSKIVGGQQANLGQFKYQVAILISIPDEGTALCGGSLISHTYVLTAAHCLDEVESVELIFGAHDRTLNEQSQVRVTVSSSAFTLHEDWDDEVIANDIALINLPSPILFTKYIQPVALPSRTLADELFVRELATISGYGEFSDAITESPKTLNFVQLPIMTNKDCSLRYPGNIRPTNICGSGENGRSACSGDSGGPFSLSKNGQNIQVGIVSFGLSLGCELGWPTVFTRVTSYLDWIESNSGIEIAQ